MSLLANSNAIESGGYLIQRSLRFRSSASAYLNRTPASSSSRTTWTWNAWVKLGTLGTVEVLFTARNTGGSANGSLYFESDSLKWDEYTGSVYTLRKHTTQVFRDPSAWYMVTIVADTSNATASNRARVYINGTQVTSFSTSVDPSQNALTETNQNILHRFGANSNNAQYFDGYLAEVNFIDGQALTPSSFGYTDPLTGVWQPLKYMGTYGTNGFYLPFSDNTSATTLAYDKSGNGNNWTPNNISTTAGATYDSMLDVPTQWADGGNGRGNYCTFNPLFKLGATAASTWASSGNLQAKSDVNASLVVYGTMGLDPSTKFYNEFTIVNTVEANDHVGIVTDIQAAADSGTCVAYKADGQKIVNGTVSSYGASYTDNDVIGIAVDLSSNQVTFYKNGVSQGAITGVTSGTYFHRVRFNNLAGQQAEAYGNWGQRPFAYTPPSGFKALNTLNLPDPTIKKPNQYMDATTYTGNGNPNNTTQTITNSGSMQPDFVWIKSRSNAYNNSLFDSVRGVANTLASNSTAAEDTTGTTMLTALNSNGFTVGSNLNGSLGSTNVNGATYVGWQWKESATSGFDIVTYTGNGSNRTISHSLGVAPSMMIVKSRSQGTTGYTGNWAVWHSAIANTEYLLLNTTAAKATGATYWNSTTPTSSVFSLGTAAVVNNNNDNFVNYLFAEIAGFSKFGSYTGNGSADGPFVYCGFRPKYVMVKLTSGADNWYVEDSARDTYNPETNYLQPNLSNAEATGGLIDFVSNGFKIRNSNTLGNVNGGTYIYAAFAESPFKYALGR